MLDSIDTVVAASAGAVLLVAICATPTTWFWRLACAGIFGAWAGLVIAIAASGGLAHPQVVGILAAFPLSVAALLAATVPAARNAMLAIPLPVIIGANVFRILGVEFLVLLSFGRLGGPFPYSAGLGDVVTGLLAIPVAVLATRVPPNHWRIVAWNVFGALDLVVAIALGVGSANGSPLQFIHGGAGSAAMASLPWSLVPTFLVPLYLIGHGIVFAHIRAASTSHRRQAPQGSTRRRDECASGF